jgi:hypothetical protein
VSVPTKANTLQVSDVVDFYLKPDQAGHLGAIHAVAQEETDANDSLLVGYAVEGARLSGSTLVHFHASAVDSLPTGGSPHGEAVVVEQGQLVSVTVVSFVTNFKP